MPARSKRSATGTKSPASAKGRAGVRSRRWSALTSGLSRAGRALGAFLQSSTALRSAAAVLGLALLAAGGFGAVRVGVPYLIEQAERRHPLDAARLRVVFQRAPSWIPQSSLDRLGDDVRTSLEGATTLAPDALEEAHRALVASGWFARVEQVARTGPNELVVTGEFRSPLALVRSNGRDHVVDAEYRRLPLAYEGSTDRPPLPLIVHVRFEPPAEAGEPWIGDDLRAAVHLARLVRERPWFSAGRIAAIDANRFPKERLLELVASEGTRIVWGADPDERSLAEMPPARKLACLDALWQANRRLDDGTGRALDLRFDAVTVASTPGR